MATKLKWGIMSVYAALVIGGYAFMLWMKGDEFAGIFVAALSFPWSFAILPLAWISPPFMDKHGSLVGHIAFLAGVLINFYVIYWIFSAIEENKKGKR